VKGELPLAWNVDRVFLQGEHLIELTGTPLWWGGSAENEAVIRVTSASDTDRVLSETSLPDKRPIVTAALREARLYVAQAERGYGGVILEDGDTNSPPVVVAPIHLSIYDVSNLPNLTLLGTMEVVLPQLGWGSALQAVWPKTGVLVLAGGGNGGWYPWAWLDAGIGLRAGDGAGFWPYWGGGSGRLIAFDVSNSAAPAFLSDVTPAEDQGWNFSSAHPVNGLLYLSHQEFAKPSPVITCDETTGVCVTNDPPDWVWAARSYLDVVDYADPNEPTLRAPVNIPGTLKGVSHDGELLYTLGSHWKSDTNWWHDGSEFVDASAYDGVSVHLVDSLSLSNTWPHPVLVKDDDVFVGHPAENVGVTNSVDVWKLNSAGRFTSIARIDLASPAQALAAFGDLLAVQSYDQTRLFDVTDPAEPEFLVGQGIGSCFWYDLGNADGNLDQGLRIPLGLFGVVAIETP
jgi:hypothetical protein